MVWFNSFNWVSQSLNHQPTFHVSQDLWLRFSGDWWRSTAKAVCVFVRKNWKWLEWIRGRTTSNRWRTSFCCRMDPGRWRLYRTLGCIHVRTCNWEKTPADFRGKDETLNKRTKSGEWKDGGVTKIGFLLSVVPLTTRTWKWMVGQLEY